VCHRFTKVLDGHIKFSQFRRFHGTSHLTQYFTRHGCRHGNRIHQDFCTIVPTGNPPGSTLGFSRSLESECRVGQHVGAWSAPSNPSAAANRRRLTVVRALSLCNSLALYVLTVFSLIPSSWAICCRFIPLPRSVRTSVSRLDKTGTAGCL
jgi:hypothetical protein